MTAYTFINNLRSKGVLLWLEKGQLRMKAPKGVLTEDIKAQIRARKAALIKILEQSTIVDQVPVIPPVERASGKLYPVGLFQERLWVLHKLNSDTPAYNIPMAILIKGKPDIELFNKAFNMIIGRHEVLRTIIHDRDGHFHQKVLDDLKFNVDVVDLRKQPAKPSSSIIKEMCEKEGELPFDLSVAPYMRVKILIPNANEYVVMISAHHIIFDDWSVNVLLRELFSIVDALNSGEDPVLPVLPIQYIDYCLWQRRWLEEGDNFAGEIVYWKERLKDIPDALDIKTDYPRPDTRNFDGSACTFKIHRELSSSLRKIADQHGCTMYMVLLAVFKVLLYRYTGQQDICLGSAVSNRQSEETENLIGMFINTLPLRTSLESDDCFIDVLLKVKSTCVGAFKNSHVPFDKIVEAMRRQGNFGVNPLFQIMVSQNIPVNLPDGKGKFIPLDRHASKFDMGVEFTEVADGYDVVIEYSTALFKEQTILRMIDNFLVLCHSVSKNPHDTIQRIRCLGVDEQKRLLVELNDTVVIYPKDKCIHDLFMEQVSQNPDKTAVIFQKERLSYRELYERSSALALYLQSMGVKPESLVGVCMDRSPQMIMALLGILQAGGAYLPLDPNYPESRIAYMMEETQCSIILTQENLKDKLDNLSKKELRTILLDTATAWERIENVRNDKNISWETRVKPHNLAYIIYTSGSTGNPKGVAIEHRNTVAFIHWAKDVFGKKELSGVLASTSICFDLSVFEIFVTLSVGGKLILVKDAFEIITSQNRNAVTLVNTVPSVMEELLRIENSIPDSILTVNLAGEPLTAVLADKIYHKTNVDKVYDLYGPSEYTTYTTFSLRKKGGAQTIGRPISNTRIYILDQFNNLLPMGALGELHVGGDGLARGYFNRQELTDERFIADPFQAASRIYKTGDLARWTEGGEIEYCGRIDKQIKIRGFRVEMGEIESRLNEYPGMMESAVVAQGDGVHKKLAAFYVLSQKDHPTPKDVPSEQLRDHLRQFLPEYMIPVSFVHLASLPLTPNRKIDRVFLENYPVISKKEVDSAISIGHERTILKIFGETLEIAPASISVDDNFFDIGGNSIMAISMAANIAKTTFSTFSPLDLFKYSTVSKICRFIEKQTRMESRDDAFQPVSLHTPDTKKISWNEAYPPYYEDSLAIVGISCRFPEAKDHWEFWNNIVHGKESVCRLSKEEALAHGVDADIVNNPDYVPLKVWMEGKEFFDPEFFQISSGNAAWMDPQFRQLLMHSWKAVEDAGYHCGDIEKTGVYMSASNNAYSSLAEKKISDSGITENSDKYVSWILSQEGTIPTMISYQLGLKGPSIFVHSNCSSSMAGLYYACQDLQSKEIDHALVGAATLSASLSLGFMQMPGMNFSSSGQCKAFDAHADGMVDGEGVGVIMLKRAMDAIRDGDHIYSLIRGIAINNDGSDKAGFYAPGISGQASVITDILEKTKINPETISYLEAHGTGTSLGDPIEVKAISEAYRKYTRKKQFCAIGSVKPNIGHLDTVAGLAGCVKIAMSFYHKKFPPLINFSTPNPRINFADSPFYVSRTVEAWEADGSPKRAGLSSFGIGGTNAHAILEEYQPIANHANAKIDTPLLYAVPLSARKEEILKNYARHLLDFLIDDGREDEIQLPQLAYTLQTGRKEMNCRVVFLVRSLEEFTAELKAFIDNKKSDGYDYGGTTIGKTNAFSLDKDEDYQDLILKWIEKKKIKKLSRLWLDGIKINWRLLYDKPFPSRVSLPTYPFEEVPCWINDALPRGMTPEKYNSPGSSVIHPLLHTNVSDFSRQKYNSLFTGNEFFIRDHQIQGKKIFPATAYLEMVRAAMANALSGQEQASSLEMTNIVWLNPLVIAGQTLVNTDLSIDESGRIHFQVLSGDAELGTLHCEGEGKFNGEPLNERFDITGLRERPHELRTGSEQLYVMFNHMGTNYGAAYRAVKEVFVADDSAYAHVELPQSVHFTHADYQLHPSLLDAALQVGNILFNRLTGDVEKDILPFALGALRCVRAACPKKLLVFARLAQGSGNADKHPKLDIDICDEAGKVYVRFAEFSFKAVSAGHEGARWQNSVSDMRLSVPFWRANPLALSPSGTGEARHQPAQQHHVVFCGISSSLYKQTASLLRDARCQELTIEKDTLDKQFTEAALECFLKIRSIFQDKLKQPVVFQFVTCEGAGPDLYGGIAGLLKTAALENPNFVGQFIQIESSVSPVQLAHILEDHASCLENLSIRYIRGVRHTSQRKTMRDEEDGRKPDVVFRDNGVYLITGGAGGLGAIFTKEILKQAQNAHVILAGRSALTKSHEEILKILNGDGNKVEYRPVNIEDPGEVENLVTSILSKHKQLNGVMHCAGIIADNFILKKTPEEFRKVLAPKVTGTVNIDSFTRELDLDFMVFFSSNSALGSLGQADYAVANGFMDWFAAYRNQLVNSGGRKGQTLSINWPYWENGGMKIDPDILRIQQSDNDFVPMTTTMGLQAFYASFALKQPQVLVDAVKISPHRAKDEKANAAYDGKMARVIVSDEPSPVKPTDFTAGDLREKTEEFLKRHFSELLKLPSHRISSKTPLEEYGIDSIVTINLTNRLEKTFGSLSKTLLFEYQTVNELSEYFIENYGNQLAALFSLPADHAVNGSAELTPERKPGAETGGEPAQFLVRKFFGSAKDAIALPHGTHTDRGKDELIAIIGLSGRYPESVDVEEFWENLRDGKDCIVEVPMERWNWREYYNANRSEEGVHYSKWGGFISGVDEFDARFFHISPREAELLDPQERLFLQHAWMAVEDAGYTRESLQIPHKNNLSGQVGVYVGVMYSEYQLFGAEISQQGRRMGFGNSLADIANRVSYVLNLHGPSYTVDTMCSSSLTSVHLACQDLKNGITDMAIAGGVNVTIHPNKYLILSSGQYISTTGHCHSFGIKGDGYIPGEGVGVLILRRLSDAEKNGDHIYGVIRGSALNHGGRSNGYTVPNPQAQAALINKVLEESNTDPRHISYIEAHGTGTPLGDPIEINSLAKAFHAQNNGSFAKEGGDGQYCLIGSVKSNIGHCESAAGVAAITKVLLQMKNRQIVPSLHSKDLNPNIDFSRTPFKVNQTLKEWENPVVDGKKIPRLAGISSFGAGGSNAHLILEEYIASTFSPDRKGKVALILSAKTSAQLEQKVADLLKFLRKNKETTNIYSLAYTLQVGREAMDERLGLLVDSMDEAIEKLRTYRDDVHDPSLGIYRGQLKRDKESMDVISEDDDMRETLEKWIAKNKLGKILGLWVRGLDFQWQKIYGNAKPERISLPAYPFAKNRYWWNDAIKNTAHLPNKRSTGHTIHPLLNTNISTLEQQCYVTAFTGNEPFLEAGENGQKILPVSAYLEMARLAVEDALSIKHDTKIVELYRVVCARPMVIDDNKDVKISLFAQGDAGVDFEISGHDANDDMVYCQGYAAISDPASSATLDVAEIRRQSDKKRLLFVSEMEERESLIPYAGLIDKALEGVVGLLPDSARYLSSPDSWESVSFASPLQGRITVMVWNVERERPDDRVRFDMIFCNEDNDVCVQFTGVSCAWLLLPSFDKERPLAWTSSMNKPLAITLGDESEKWVSAPSNTPAHQSGVVLTELTDDFSLRTDPASQEDCIHVSELDKGIFSLQISNPILSTEVVGQLVQAIGMLAHDEHVKVLLIEGGESEFLQGGLEHYNDAVEQGLYRKIVEFPYPVIAVMKGSTTGAGFLFATLCDFMIGNGQALYAYADSGKNLFPTPEITELLKERFGTRQAYNLLCTPFVTNGKECRESGLSFPIMDRNDVAEYAHKLAVSLAGKPRKSLLLLKKHLSRPMVKSACALTVIYPDSPAGAKGLPNADVAKNFPPCEGIVLTTYNHDILGIQFNNSGEKYSINDYLERLLYFFRQIEDTREYRAVVIEDDCLELAPASDPEAIVGVISDLSRAMVTAGIPVIGVLKTGSTGLSWLLALIGDGCIYNRDASYSFAGLPQSELMEKALAVLIDQFGYTVAKEILLSNGSYAGDELKERFKIITVAKEEQLLPLALSMADHWSSFPASVVNTLKRRKAKHVAEIIETAHATPENQADPLPGKPFQASVISLEVASEGVLVVKMEDRASKNMFSEELTRSIIEVFEHIKRNPMYKVVVLTGFDNYFASGGTKEDLLSIQSGKSKFTDTKFYHFPMECPVPVIAAMQGHAIGAGWSFGMFADFVFFSEESKYFSPYMNFGFTPGAGATAILPATVGLDLARESFFGAMEMSGLALQDRGISMRVVPRKQVLSEAMALAKQIVGIARERTTSVKRLLTEPFLHGLEEIYRLELKMHEETFVGQTETLAQIHRHFGNVENERVFEEEQLQGNHPDAGKDIPDSVLLDDLKKYLSEELHMPVEEIDEKAQFIDLGLDSITGVTWIRKINERYNVSIEATKVYSYPTLYQFTRFVKKEMAAQGRNGEAISGNDGSHTVISYLKKFLAEELHMQENEIDEDTQFNDLGLDSITGVTWVRKINEFYHLSIETTKIYSFPTLNIFCEFIRKEIKKKKDHREDNTAFPEERTALPASIRPEKSWGTINRGLFYGKKLTPRSQASNKKYGSPNKQAGLEEPIAIIGMAGQFPQAGNLEEYWENIREAKDCITVVPKARWDVDQYYSGTEAAPGKTNSKWQGSLEGYDQFDPLFFNISPKEAESMDPQQRLFLQTSWHAIENAGYNADELSASKCGVFVGAAAGDYQLLSRELQISAKGFTGSSNSILASRISYFLNLQGPCMSIDTACSSSLVAIATACDSLIAKNSDMALAGGVCVMATPDLHIKSAQSGMLSKDGKCYTFDNRANGFVPGEGVGVVILKRLSDAERDGDHILGVIQGWGINQDGKTNGITAPSPESQKRLMQEVYDKFHIDPAQIQLIEAHGTGTKLGDPIEVSALIDAFGKYTQRKDFCALGSVKSNIGHCLAAAGVAGFIKLVLSIKNKKIPPTIHFEQLNEHIHLKDTPFYVSDKLQDMRTEDFDKFQAAISAFGFSGTNCHMVIAEYVAKDTVKKPSPRNAEVIIPLTAKNREQLNQKVRDLQLFLLHDAEVDMYDMAFTLQTGRAVMDTRLAFLVKNMDELKMKLQAYVHGERNMEGVFMGEVSSNKEGMQFINKEREVHEALIDKWISNRQFSKLLSGWVQGLNFNWSRLVGNDKPRRMELPLYPFSKETYWIKVDPHRQDDDDRKALIIHPLLHVNTSNFVKLSYVTHLTGEEFFLKDHVVDMSKNGQSSLQKVLPGVACLEMARAAIADAMAHLVDDRMLELQDVLWIRPVTVIDEKQLMISLLPHDQDAEQVNFEIYSSEKDELVEHCRGRGVMKTQLPPRSIAVDELKESMKSNYLDKESIYSTLRGMGLLYGPAHQTVQVIYRDRDQVLAQLEVVDSMGYTHNEKFVLHPGLLDGALQAAIGLPENPHEMSSQPSLPFAVEKVSIITPCTRKMYSWIRPSSPDRQETNLQKLDVDLLSDKGNVCVEIRGFVARAYRDKINELPQKQVNDPKAGERPDMDDSSFDMSFYESVIENIVNNTISIEEALNIR